MGRLAIVSLCTLCAAGALAACGDDEKTVTERVVTKTETAPTTGQADTQQTDTQSSTEPQSDLESCDVPAPDGAGVFEVRQAGFDCAGIEDFTSNWMSTCAAKGPGETCSLGEFDCVTADTGTETVEVTCTGGESPSGRARVVFKVGS